MAELLNWIMDSIRLHGAWSVFVGVIIESVIVPIPSPLVIMGAGFVLISAELELIEALEPILIKIVLPGSIASTVGSYVGYGIGYMGGKPLIERWKHFFGFSWSDVDAMERRFQGGRANISIFLLRALPIFPLSLISAAAGLIRLPLKEFSVWTFFGTLPRCLFLGYLGWGLGETYQSIARGIDRAESIISALIIVAIFAGILWLKAKVRGRILKH